jgi:predicted metal-dependent hydrolase
MKTVSPVFLCFNFLTKRDIAVEVVKKDIKNVHLSVYPPAGRVKISAPLRMKLETIRVYAIAKLGWIKQQQKKLREQRRETPREYLDRESHYFGESAICCKSSSVSRRQLWSIRPGTAEDKKQAIFEEWYRS